MQRNSLWKPFRKVFFLTAVLWLCASAAVFGKTAAERPVTATDVYAQMNRSQKQELKRLWKAHNDAYIYSDQEAALVAIKEYAAAGRFSKDFYESGRQLVALRVGRNWKVRESEMQRLSDELKQHGFLLETVMDSYDGSYYWTLNDRMKELVAGQREALRKVRTSAWYASLPELSGERLSDGLDKVLTEDHTIANDYEFLLWCLLVSEWNPLEKAHWANLLQEELSGWYPAAPLAEYYAVSDSAGYEAFKVKHTGTGAALLGEAWLISHELEVADRLPQASEDVYKRLRERCEVFHKEQRAWRKDPLAGRISSVKNVQNQLDEKRITLSVRDSVIYLVFKNMQKASLRITGENQTGRKYRWSQSFNNPACRYYLRDTVTIPMPAVPDGDYTFKAHKSECFARLYSVAVTNRSDRSFREFYVTDSRSGKPVDSVAIWLERSDTVAKAPKVPLIANFTPDGFTTLPRELEEAAADSLHSWRWWVTTSDGQGLFRASEKIDLNRIPDAVKPTDSFRGALYADRTVVLPGEAIRFKGIAWIRHADGTQEVLPEAANLRAVLTGPRGAKGDTLLLNTNEFGAVSGSFSPDKEAKNGTWQVQLLHGNRHLCSTSFIVGDIVLPTFEIRFDPLTEIALPRDPMTITGRVTYLSGHNASGTLVRWRSNGQSGEEICDDEGLFRIVLRDSLAWNHLQVQATSTEGETRSENRSYNRNLRLSVETLNPGNGRTPENYTVLNSKQLKVRFTVPAPDGAPTAHPVSWRIKARDGETWQEVLSGTIPAGELLKADLSGQKSTVFRLEAESKATNRYKKEYNTKVTQNYLVVTPQDNALQAPVEWFLEKVESDGVAASFGGAAGDLWAIAELWGRDPAGNTLRLGTRKIHIDGMPGAAGSLQSIRFERQSDWPENLTLTLLWIKDRRLHRERLDYYVPRQEIPLEFTRFTDAMNPGAESTIKLHTQPGVEGVAVVYDKAMDAIRSNVWRTFCADGGAVTIPWARFYDGSILVCDDDDMPVVIAYGLGKRGGMEMMKTPMMMAKSATRMVAEMAVAEEAVATQEAVSDDASPAPEPESFRSNLAPVLAFEPFLRPDAEGNISFAVKASDRLSQFVVRTLVHDRQARSSVVEKVMTVSLPVRTALLPPALLYVGDKPEFAVTAANASDVPVTGKLSIWIYDGTYTPGRTPIRTASQEVTVPGGATVSRTFTLGDVPACSSDTLGVLVSFSSDGATDALAQAVPVYPRSKQITETHSMLLRGGEDLAAAKAELLARFQNAAPGSVVFEERTVADLLSLLEERLCRYEREDAISLANALLVKTLLGQPTDSIAQKLALCRNADGGYGWMKGMHSSAYVTAMLLDRFARIGKRDADTRKALQYLDATCLGEKKTPYWRGGISMPIYLYIRSLYPELPIVGRTSYARDEEAHQWLDPRRENRKYSSLFERALRARTLLNMTVSDQGVDLAKHFGLTFFAEKKLRRSLEIEAANLLDYAVEHPSGGWYYPNLVMPWRGLMESEAYAHVFMCDILRDIVAREGSAVPSGGTNGALRESPALPEQHAPVTRAAEVADGIRLWLLVQRETQAWTEEPAYALAVAAIREGSPKLLQTRILIARSTAELPLEKIKASGNGMKIDRKWQVKRGGKWVALTDGSKLRVGETVRSVLNLHSDENRSFVVVTAPRPGNLQPVNQISGYAGFRSGYRDVRRNRTEFLFDAYPEEKLSLTEDFYVTHTGSFTYAPAEIVCTYADHYRATDRYRP